MKKNLRFYLAFYISKLATLFLKLLRRNASYAPGAIAIKLCPDFIGRIGKPKKIIAVSQTNGKTTSCNLIEEILRVNGYDFLDNHLGSNTNAGIATTLINGANLKGNAKKDLAILEIDERSSTRIYPYLTPNYLLCGNLFRDSFMRNAHTEYISDILTNYIPGETKLVLNADDLISSNIAPSNDRVYFSISRQESDNKESKNIAKDIVVCPKCNTKLEYEYYRYHHLGKATCPLCGFTNHKEKYLLTTIDYKDNFIVINDEKYKLISDNLINIYNELGVISLLLEIGLTKEQIDKGLNNINIVSSRYDSENYKGINIISQMAKGINPVAVSRAFDFAKNIKGNKAVIIFVDDTHINKVSCENISWWYDTDFELLNDESIKQVIFAGPRYKDAIVRLKLASIPEEKIVTTNSEIEAAKKVDLTKVDTVVILHDITAMKERDNIKNTIKGMIL